MSRKHSMTWPLCLRFPLALALLSLAAASAVSQERAAPQQPLAPFTAEPECRDLATLAWLLGRWEADAGDRTVREIWQRASSRTFEGYGETRSKAQRDDVSYESLRLVEMMNEVFYIAKVTHNALPTAFKLTGCSAGHAVFENPEHDFPRRLEYRREGLTAFTVTVSDGQDKGFQLLFRREARSTMPPSAETAPARPADRHALAPQIPDRAPH